MLNNTVKTIQLNDTLICIFILNNIMSQGLLDDELFTLFLTEGAGITNEHPNPASKWLSDKSWAEIIQASQLPR